MAGHFWATARRTAACEELTLVLQDTTEFAYQRKTAENIGFSKYVTSGRDKDGCWRQHKLCGVLMHASLAITLEGLPLGLTAARFWTRAQFKRLAGAQAQGQPNPRADQDQRKYALAREHARFDYKRVNLLPPIGKARRYPPLSLTVIHATEVDPPEGRKPIDWKLLTDLPDESTDQVIEKMAWYAMRWKIELFFKILKSGCNAEKLKLQTAERLVNLIAIFCILSWRIFWMTMLNRARPNENPECAPTPAEIGVIDQIAARAGRVPPPNPKLSDYLREIARLGGYLARSHDPPPGNMIIWRGWSRLMDIQLGVELAGRLVGN